jgi:hypothetical protein
MKDNEVMFTGTLTKEQMKQFKDEAIKQGVSRIHLLRIWIARAARRNKK